MHHADLDRTLRHLWGISIDAITMEGAVDRLSRWIVAAETSCHLVATPNVDHVVQAHRQPELRAIFEASSMTLADGWPLVTMSRLYGPRLPERVPGSDLLPELCERFPEEAQSAEDAKRLRLFLLGGRPGVPERAKATIHTRWPGVEVVGVASPPLGFEDDEETNSELCDQVNASGANVLVVGLGFPKQEKWIVANRRRLNVAAALALGGTIDFLAGEQTRAPRWLQRLRLEWLHRLATNPRRLARRYATDALWFPWICLSHLVNRRSTKS